MERCIFKKLTIARKQIIHSHYVYMRAKLTLAQKKIALANIQCSFIF